MFGSFVDSMSSNELQASLDSLSDKSKKKEKSKKGNMRHWFILCGLFLENHSVQNLVRLVINSCLAKVNLVAGL